MPGTPCPPDCSCGRHRSKKCEPGCTCPKHKTRCGHCRVIGHNRSVCTDRAKREPEPVPFTREENIAAMKRLGYITYDKEINEDAPCFACAAAPRLPGHRVCESCHERAKPACHRCNPPRRKDGSIDPREMTAYAPLAVAS